MSFSLIKPLRVCTGQSPIYQAGQRGQAWRVRQGVVRLDRQSGPICLPVQLAVPGDVIGIEALCGEPYQFTAEAFTDCELEPVEAGARDDVLALARQADLLREVLLQQQTRSHDMATLRTGSVVQRLTHLLRLLGLPWQGLQTVASHQADTVRQALPTLRAVAELVDAKTETVCRALAQLLPPRSRKSGPPRKRPAPAPMLSLVMPVEATAGARAVEAWGGRDRPLGIAA